MLAEELRLTIPARITAVISVNTTTSNPFFEITLDVEAGGTVIASTTIPLANLLIACLDCEDDDDLAAAWYSLAALALRFDTRAAHEHGHHIIRLHGSW